MTVQFEMPRPDPPLPVDLARKLVERAESACGVRIEAQKTDFLRLRVGRRLRSLGLGDFASYVRLLDADLTGAETRHLVECLTTHTTSFFREVRQYDWLAGEGIDLLLEGRDRSPFTVWSAAASLGAELWSAGILLSERRDRSLGPADWRLRGSDISSRVLRRAQAATFTEDEMTGLSPERIRRFFLQSRNLRDQNGRPLYRVAPEFRRNARFAEGNLQDLSGLESFTADIAFLRNVLIYFAPQTQARVVSNVVARLRPGGILLTGHAETLAPHPALVQLRPTIYRKV